MRVALFVAGSVVVVVLAALGGFVANDQFVVRDSDGQNGDVLAAQQQAYFNGYAAGIAVGRAQSGAQCDVIVGEKIYKASDVFDYVYVVRTPQGGAYEVDRSLVRRQFASQGRIASIGDSFPPTCQ